MYEGVLDAKNLIVFGGFCSSFSFLSLRAGEKRGGEEGSRSVAVLGARLATAVSCSIF